MHLIDCPDRFGRTPLYIAACCGFVEIVCILLDADAKICIDDFIDSAIIGACDHEQAECLSLLLAAATPEEVNAVISKTGYGGAYAYSALSNAIMIRNIGMVRLLLQYPAINVNAGNGLDMACRCNLPEFVSMLLATPGIDVNLRSIEDAFDLPIEVAAYHDDSVCFNLLASVRELCWITTPSILSHCCSRNEITPSIFQQLLPFHAYADDDGVIDSLMNYGSRLNRSTNIGLYLDCFKDVIIVTTTKMAKNALKLARDGQLDNLMRLLRLGLDANRQVNLASMSSERIQSVFDLAIDNHCRKGMLPVRKYELMRRILYLIIAMRRTRRTRVRVLWLPDEIIWLVMDEFLEFTSD
jgi:hypothetical protein